MIGNHVHLAPAKTTNDANLKSIHDPTTFCDDETKKFSYKTITGWAIPCRTSAAGNLKDRDGFI
jgi:hypothetical protein